MAADTLGVEMRQALEIAAGPGAVFIDRAAVIRTEKLAAAIDVRQGMLDHDPARPADRHLHREWRKTADFLTTQDGGIVVPILAAAGGVAVMTGALAQDRNTQA